MINRLRSEIEKVQIRKDASVEQRDFLENSDRVGEPDCDDRKNRSDNFREECRKENTDCSHRDDAQDLEKLCLEHRESDGLGECVGEDHERTESNQRADYDRRESDADQFACKILSSAEGFRQQSGCHSLSEFTRNLECDRDHYQCGCHRIQRQ